MKRQEAFIESMNKEGVNVGSLINIILVFCKDTASSVDLVTFSVLQNLDVSCSETTFF